MTSSSERRSYVPNVNCLGCAEVIQLDRDTYQNYRGPVPCPKCKAHTNVVIRAGELESALGGTNWAALVMDLESYDIPVPILEDVLEAAAVFSINARKSCVVMCGRAMHGALLAKQVKDGMLGAMLKEAAAKGLITEDLLKTTQAANYFRVTGAHHKELREVDQTKALLTFEVTKNVLKHIFPQSLTPAWKAARGSNAP